MGRGHVFLTGFMAAGKTTVGRALAEALGVDFVDLDDEIERTAGRSIPDLFATSEEEFRDLEEQALSGASQGDRQVIALGGGALGRPQSRERVAASGVLVYLKADQASLLRRLGQHAIARPVLEGVEGRTLESSIASLLAERADQYEKAAVIVDSSDGRTVEEIVQEVIDALDD